MSGSGSPVRVTHSGSRVVEMPTTPVVLLPGSFNPLHAGHLGLAEAAEELLGRPVAFELSVANVDKPPLSPEEVDRRLAQFVGRAEVWLTAAPRFVEKARWFSGATFVVGADTAARIVSAQYYDGEVERRDAALARLCEANCSFVTAARADAEGRCWRLEDLDIPLRFRDLFVPIPETRFRLDLCSTDLRRRLRADP